MTNDILTLILAPLAIGFLLLYVQQLGKMKELRNEAESKKEKVSELLSQLKKTSEQYEEALRATRDHYGKSEDDKNIQIEWSLRYIHALKELTRTMAEIASENIQKNQRGMPTLLSGAIGEKKE